MTDTALLAYLQEAANAVEAAREGQRKTLKACYPKGTYVRWKAGPHTQPGTVDGHLPWAPELWAINSNTGKRVKVSEYAIREALKDA